MGDEAKRIARLWAEYLPRIEEAKARAAKADSVCFVDLHEERILDLPAIVLTIERYLLLDQAGVFDGTCGDEVSAVVLFLWIVNPDFEADPKKSKKFFRKHRKLDLTAYAKAIEDYVERMFQGVGSSSSGGSGGSSDSGKTWVASILDLIASEYGWREEEIFRIPIPRLFHYAARIRRRHGGSSIEFTEEADRLKAEFMRKADELREGEG